eukprot:TRINITY_DN21214_c0_g1_i1.p1 TRINITY_DN21214_c0_g1~~TRINITY_DN21214_c0_g1_i1.p1  ORF type:complete len:155 (-),score=39.55 TRINITY_DN21214_c0_g1_i1:22-486(-)
MKRIICYCAYTMIWMQLEMLAERKPSKQRQQDPVAQFFKECGDKASECAERLQNTYEDWNPPQHPGKRPPRHVPEDPTKRHPAYRAAIAKRADAKAEEQRQYDEAVKKHVEYEQRKKREAEEQAQREAEEQHLMEMQPDSKSANDLGFFEQAPI